ncbi:MAG: tetratricopeptide repeat protein [Limisphaerales bacterium]
MSSRQFSPLFGAGLLGFLLLLSSTRHIGAAETLSHFEQANRLYEQGNYAEAASLYESMVKAGRHAASIYFNLGNAHFKQGELGRALFNYRRAERLAPRDPDIQANLRFTRERVDGGISLVQPTWQRVFQYFTLNEITAVTTLLFWAWASVFCVVRFRLYLRSKLRGVGFISAGLLGSALILLGFSYLIARERTAIVAVTQATVHLGPLPESQSAFTASDGAELRILAERQDWLQVSDRSERSGWIASTNVLIF